MSYILQALKKSEQEREELSSSFRTKEEPITTAAIKAGDKGAAGSYDVATPTAINWRVVLLISSVLMLLVTLVYLNHNPAVEPVVEINDEGESIGQVLIKEIRLSKLSIDKDISPKLDGSGPVEGITASRKADERNQTVDQSGLIANESRIIRPSIAVEQAPKNIQSLIPKLEISSHIYSSLALRRSIVVNGARLVEGDFISPEIQVKEITQQGMIIDVNGWPLVVSRSRGWSR